MQKTEAQHSQTESQAAGARGRALAVFSPQGEQIAQLEAMIASNPQAEKHRDMAAMMSASPAMAAQRKMFGMIHNSPGQAAQRKLAEGINNSPVMAAQRRQFEAVQRAGEEEPLQGKFTSESPAQLEQQPAAKPNNTGLPDNLKSGIENLSGMSMDSVRVHYNSSQPAQLNALAYAQGTDIHVAPGQEQHLPHEAWHVVQQAQGRVRPTMQAKGTAINDDAGLETEADVFGRRAASVGALQRKSIESDPIYPDPIYPVNDDQRLEHEADVMGGRAIAGTDSGRIQRVAIAGGQVEKTCLNSPSSQAVAQCVMNKLAFGTWKTKTTADLTLVAFTGSLSDKKSTATSIVASRGTLQNVNQELDAAIDIYNLTPNKANLLAVLKKVEELDGAIYAQQDAYEGSVSASPYDRAYMGLLGELASQMEAVLLNLNNEADSLTGIARIGAGNAPELNKDEALRRKVKERKLNSTKKADLISAVPNEDTASKSELREGLTIDSALASGTFTSLSKHENAGVDVDFVTNHPINGYKHWDQKAMYLEGPTWDGRVEHTHAKDVEDNGKKTGILLDTTYATGKDYERGWLALNKSILSGKLDPKAIKETKLANATTTTKDILFDSTLKSQPKGDDNLINLKLLHKDIKDAGFITQQIAVDLNGLLAQVQTKVDSRAFTAYRNHRGRLAAGNYIEINGIRFNDGQSGAKVRVVINTIIGHCYLTVTHYDPFTWQDSNAAQNSKSPFFELSALNGKITLPTE